MYRYTTRDVHCYLRLQEKIHCKMSMQHVWHLMHRILQVYWRRMLYLSLQIDSLVHCIRYANIKVFYDPHFPVYGQNARRCGKIHIRENPYIPIFTQCDVFHWLAQKTTHYWARIIDVILKIKNCIEVFSFAILLSHFFISWRFLTKSYNF